MVVEITGQGIIAFALAMGLLVMFSIMDLKTRRVPNDIMIIGLILGILAGIVTGHLLDQLLLHLIALVVALLFSIVLFRRGAIGGADAKSIILLACISPGFEFGLTGDILFEGILGVLVPLLIMFVMGILFKKRVYSTDDRPTPLIPCLLIGYLLVQMLAFI